MGAYSRRRSSTRELARWARRASSPDGRRLRREGTPFKGALYAGLMLTTQRAAVLEFNCRFGDPETQVLMMRLKTDLLEVMLATAPGRSRRRRDPMGRPRPCSVVTGAGGYPGNYEPGMPITGIEERRRDARGEGVPRGNQVVAGRRLVRTAGGCWA